VKVRLTRPNRVGIDWITGQESADVLKSLGVVSIQDLADLTPRNIGHFATRFLLQLQSNADWAASTQDVRAARLTSVTDQLNQWVQEAQDQVNTFNSNPSTINLRNRRLSPEQRREKFNDIAKNVGRADADRRKQDPTFPSGKRLGPLNDSSYIMDENGEGIGYLPASPYPRGAAYSANDEGEIAVSRMGKAPDEIPPIGSQGITSALQRQDALQRALQMNPRTYTPPLETDAKQPKHIRSLPVSNFGVVQ